MTERGGKRESLDLLPSLEITFKHLTMAALTDIPLVFECVGLDGAFIC